MVVFSNQAATATPDMKALAEGSIQSSNDTFTNSDAGVNFNLVHHQQISYDESGSAPTDLDRLEGTSDGDMDNVHSLRNQYGADVVVLIISNSPGLCGIASGIEVGSSDAFAVVTDNCSIGNYSFAHEIGHLAGARHDSDPNNSPRSYAHGFRYDPGYWRTVMAVYDPVVSRIAYWSNPDTTYGGVTMGSTDWEDNTRVWDERAATMADFRSTAPPPPSVYLTGPASMAQGSSGTFTANASGGTPPYSYEWAYKNDNDTYWTIVFFHNSSTYEHTAGPPPGTDIRVEVRDSQSQENNDHKHVNISYAKVVDGPEIPDKFAIGNNYPNPFNPVTNIEYQLPEQSDVRLEVYNLLGQQVATVINETQSAGFYTATFDGHSLSSGMYIARMEAVGQSGEQLVKELTMQLIK